jgi:hypothetical protein
MEVSIPATTSNHQSNGTRNIAGGELCRNGWGCVFLGPSSFDLQTTLHFTRQIPPLFPQLSSPFQKKLHLILSIFLISHFGRGKTIVWHVTTAVSIELANWSLAAFVMYFLFYAWQFAPYFVQEEYQVCFPQLMCSGRPKYWHEKSLTTTRKSWRVVPKSMPL